MVYVISSFIRIVFIGIMLGFMLESAYKHDYNEQIIF